MGWVDTVVASKSDALAILVREDAPAIDLLFVDPSRSGGRARGRAWGLSRRTAAASRPKSANHADGPVGCHFDHHLGGIERAEDLLQHTLEEGPLIVERMTTVAATVTSSNLRWA